MRTEHTLTKNSNVVVGTLVDDAGLVNAHINVDGRFEHTFSGCSRFSQYLATAANPEQLKAAQSHLQDRLNGGQFFFVDGALADFRDRFYDGYTHTEQSINQLMELIGVESKPTRKLRSSIGLTTPASDVALIGRVDASHISVPGYLEGGAFTTGLIHSWSPFCSHIKTVFEIVRLICQNGAVAGTDLINTKIPLVNRWEEHLAIAERQLQNQINSTVTKRLQVMGQERATVLDLQKLVEIGRARLEEAEGVDQINRIHRLIHTANPETHLNNFYNPIVFEDASVAAKSHGHLTVFDTWNIATEMMTHTNGTEGGSDKQLQRMANSFLFPKKDSAVGRIHTTTPIASTFSDPNRAFFGIAA